MIRELKKEHSVIIDVINKIKKLGIGSKEGNELALSAKRNILNHIKKEDEKLYPVLRKAVKSNRKLEEILDVFARNTGAVSDTVFHFFDNYSTKAGNQLEIEMKWLIETLTWRMQREENLLFTMYENLHKKEVSG